MNGASNENSVIKEWGRRTPCLDSYIWLTGSKSEAMFKKIWKDKNNKENGKDTHSEERKGRLRNEGKLRETGIEKKIKRRISFKE